MVVYLSPKLYKETITNLFCRSYESYFHQNSVQMLEIYIFLTIFSCAKKMEDDGNLKKKNAKSFKIFLFTLPDVDDLIKHTFAY